MVTQCHINLKKRAKLKKNWNIEAAIAFTDQETDPGRI